MTLGTQEITAVIKRFVGQPRMPVISRQPASWAVAKATILRGIEVPGIHAGSRGAIVAGRAGPQNLSVVNGDNRCPDIRAVAILTNIGCEWVQWTLADRVCSVVAADTVVDDVRVVEVGWQPRDGGVAVVAIVAAGNMRRMLANRYYTVMAGAAGADDLRMVNRKCRNPGVWCMAIFADNTGKNMVGVLAGCIRTVVAARTIASDIDVVKVCR